MIPENPLVSIIIPTYNRAHIIGETLESVLVQTYQNWECIVVDDGSTDYTHKVVTSYIERDSRFHFYTRPQNRPKGANACRNYGFEKCKGAFIQWFDSDDLMHSKKLEIKIKYALARDADIIISNHTTEDNIILPNNPNVEVFESDRFHLDYILGKMPIITNDVMAKNEIIGLHRFDEYIHKAQEYEFFVRLFEQKLKFLIIREKLCFYRQSLDSISKGGYLGKRRKAESLIYLTQMHIAKFKDDWGIVAKCERQGRKTYKDAILNNYLGLILKNFNFFRKCHHKSVVIFTAFICYNCITKSGFDVIKPKRIYKQPE